ncbi:MAG: hypothetical protein OEV92_00480 [Nitrospinota bacterium]|nr:hypothetical protein [Nitrospinota bacterium]
MRTESDSAPTGAQNIDGAGGLVKIAAAALRGLEIALNFVIVSHLVAIIYFLLFGPVVLYLSDYIPQAPRLSLAIRDAGKPALTILIAMALRMAAGFGSARLARRNDKAGQMVKGVDWQTEAGPPLLALCLALATYLVYINVYSTWKGAVVGLWKESGRKTLFAQVAGKIPGDAVIFASSGAYYTFYKKLPNARLLQGVEAAFGQAGASPVYFVIDTYLGESRKELEALELMRNPAYHLLDFQDGLYLFGPGAKGALDLQVYASQLLTFSAESLEGQVGAIFTDFIEPSGFIRKANPAVDKPGILVYGRYITLWKGHNEAVFRLKVQKRVPDEVVELDVVYNHGNKVAARRRIRGEDFKAANEWQEFRLPFDLADEVVETVQPRVIYMGVTGVSFSRLWAEPDPASFSH